MSPTGTLHMDTDAVRAMAARLARFADTLRSTNSRIIRMADVIDWSGPAHDEFTAEIDKWSQNFRPFVDTSQLMSQQLKNEADEWERVASIFASSKFVSINVPSYIHPENMNSTDPARIEDIKSYLMSTPYGRELLKYFEENGIIIEFGDKPNPHTVGNTSPKGDRIILDIDYANLSDAELAAVLVHEGTHALRLSHPEENIPLWGPILNDLHFWTDGIPLLIFPWHNEYAAYRAEAEFWKSAGGGLPYSPIINKHMDMIFTPDGGYRNFYDSMQILHNTGGYDHLLDPTPSDANIVAVADYLLNKFLGV